MPEKFSRKTDKNNNTVEIEEVPTKVWVLNILNTFDKTRFTNWLDNFQLSKKDDWEKE